MGDPIGSRLNESGRDEAQLEELREIAGLLARGVRRYFENNDPHLDVGASGWLPSPTDGDIANAVNAFPSDGEKGVAPL